MDLPSIPIISASALERLWNCPASSVLPASTRTLRVGRRGTDIHSHVHRVASGMPALQSLMLVPAEWRGTCGGIDFKRLWGDLDKVRSEVAYGLNVRTDEVREIGVNIGRAYPDLGEGWIFGTLDIEGERIDGVWAAPDVKSGFLETTAPDENFQLGFAGRVLSIVHEADEVDVRIANIRTDGSVFVQPASYDRLALDDWGDRFVEVVDGVAQARAEYAKTGRAVVNEGAWCRYCPALTSCPAKTAMAKAMLPTLADIDARLRSMTPDELGRAYEIAHDQIRPTLERVLDFAKAAAVQSPVPLSSGKVLAPTYQMRENFVQERALTLLRELGAKQEQLDGLYVAKEVEQVKAIWPATARKNAKKKATA